jgi:UAA transporter family
MLVGMVLNKKSYPWIEYIEAAMITGGVAMFTFSEKSGAGHIDAGDSLTGVGLLALYLFCDSFTSQWQVRMVAFARLCYIGWYSIDIVHFFAPRGTSNRAKFTSNMALISIR